MTPLQPPSAEVPAAASKPGARLRVLRPVLAVCGAISRRPGESLVVVLLLGLIAFGLTLGGFQFWASYHLHAARAELKRHHYNEAGTHLEACLFVRGNSDPEVLLLIARASRCSGMFDQTEDFLDRYLKVCGRDEALVLERILLTADRGNIDDVIKYCQTKVEQNDPASPEILEAFARGSLRAYRLNEADWATRTWVEREPNNAMAQYLRGQVSRERLADSEAAVAFRRALDVDPEFDDARTKLAELLLDTKQGNEAKPHFEYLMRRRPNDLTLRVHLAECCDLIGEQDEAIRLLDEVLARDPHQPSALRVRGKLALNAGTYQVAEPMLREAYERSPWDGEALLNLQKCLNQSGKTEQAKQLEPQIKKAKENMEKMDQLFRDLQTAPRNPEIQYQIGILMLDIHSYEQAVRRLESAVRLDPQHVKAHEALADFYERVGETAKAARHKKLAREAAGTQE